MSEMCLDQPQSREEAKTNPPPRSPQVFMEEGMIGLSFGTGLEKEKNMYGGRKV